MQVTVAFKLVGHQMVAELPDVSCGCFVPKEKVQHPHRYDVNLSPSPEERRGIGSEALSLLCFLPSAIKPLFFFRQTPVSCFYLASVTGSQGSGNREMPAATVPPGS